MTSLRRRAIVSCVCLPVMIAGAQPDAGSLEGLDAGSLAERDAAELALRESDRAVIDDLLLVLASTDLSPEAHRRVARVAFDLFASSPRAGMGVEFDVDSPRKEGVPIRRAIPNFPAAEFIQAGDVILVADGVVLENNDMLGAIIVSHSPGDTLPVTLLRGEEKLELEIPLGSYSDLEQRSRVNLDRLLRAFAHKCERLGALERKERAGLGRGLSLDDWARAELGMQDGAQTPPSDAVRPVPRSQDPLVRGGRPRPSEASGTNAGTSNAITAARTAAARRARSLASRLSDMARQRLRLRHRIESGGEPESIVVKLRENLEELDARIEDTAQQLGAPIEPEGSAQPSP